MITSPAVDLIKIFRQLRRRVCSGTLHIVETGKQVQSRSISPNRHANGFHGGSTSDVILTQW